MASRNIYKSSFDEDVRTDSCANQCPECEGWVTTNSVETVCEDCGLIIEEAKIDHGPEWGAYDDDECERTGAPLTAARHDRGLSTEIGRGTDANGNELSGQKRRRLARMRREHSRGRRRSKAERNLAHGLGEVRRLASALELPDTVRDQACQLFRRPSTRICFVADPSRPWPQPACTGRVAVTGSRGYWARSARYLV